MSWPHVLLVVAVAASAALSVVGGKEHRCTKVKDVENPLLGFVMTERRDVLEQMLRVLPPDMLNECDNVGFAPIHWLPSVDDARVTDLMLAARGVRVAMRTSAGSTVLHLAATTGNAMLTEALLRHGEIDPNTRDDDGYTALHDAARYGSVEAATLLLEDARTVPLARTPDGDTALDIASRRSWFTVVDAILAHPDVPDDTPLQPVRHDDVVRAALVRMALDSIN